MKSVVAYLEDEPAVRENFCESFEDEGFEVRACANLDELASLDYSAIDLFVLDIGIGNQADAGFKACHDILARIPHARVIFLTMRSTPSEMEVGRKLGAVAHLSKELPLNEIIDTFRVQLNDSRRIC